VATTTTRESFGAVASVKRVREIMPILKPQLPDNFVAPVFFFFPKLPLPSLRGM
jgi:hypothetical protein